MGHVPGRLPQAQMLPQVYPGKGRSQAPPPGLNPAARTIKIEAGVAISGVSPFFQSTCTTMNGASVTPKDQRVSRNVHGSGSPRPSVRSTAPRRNQVDRFGCEGGCDEWYSICTAPQGLPQCAESETSTAESSRCETQRDCKLCWWLLNNHGSTLWRHFHQITCTCFWLLTWP